MPDTECHVDLDPESCRHREHREHEEDRSAETERRMSAQWKPVHIVVIALGFCGSLLAVGLAVGRDVLTKSEAASTYVTKEAFDAFRAELSRFQERTDAAFVRTESKLDRSIENQNRMLARMPVAERGQ